METTHTGSGFGQRDAAEAEGGLLPMRQRIAWIAALWLGSVATLGLLSWLLADTLA
jgi:hypothetical protein